MFPGWRSKKLQPRGVTFVVCNVAHTSSAACWARRSAMTADAAKAELEKGLIPGFIARTVRRARRASRAGKGEVHVLLRWVGNRESAKRETGDGKRESGNPGDAFLERCGFPVFDIPSSRHPGQPASGSLSDVHCRAKIALRFGRKRTT